MEANLKLEEEVKLKEVKLKEEEVNLEEVDLAEVNLEEEEVDLVEKLEDQAVVSINFAYPLGPYDNLLNNWCTSVFCHVEASFEINAGVFRILIGMCMDDAYDTRALKTLVNTLKGHKGMLNVGFYILFGECFTVRFLSKNNAEPFLRTPASPVYETCVLPLKSVDDYHSLICWNIRNLGKQYDIPRAVCVLLPVTLGTPPVMDKFFCSQLIMHMGRDNNLFDVGDLNIDHVTPDDVYRFLTQLAI